ncbi:MAG: hypothetical protein P0Y53_04395 [Candidatus Pseudobacter hemicellulosilyticus]|uniref:Long-chain fatty acid transport protein n=1 Tax=Candidatus Pseudobacter hemicellulosilyticus TaxID=3121375 RepID=A0AAJ5WWA4_9BACT|nr:MAG: hypothetical protein P0Y53_04395 [Pseudobacter sp.]
MAQAQTENSPYSRYGLGDLVPTQNMATRGIGGVSAAYFDQTSINFVNPASYGRLQSTILDIGVEWNTRTLKATDPVRKFNSYSPNISYVQLAFPIKKNGGWGINLGLRPITRINYKITDQDSLYRPGFTDTLDVNTLYEGSGGTYQAHVGTGFRIARNFTAGINVGYTFGSKDYSTKTTLVDTSTFYYKSNHQRRTSYGGFLFNAGLQYVAKLNKSTFLQMGVYGNLEQNFNAKEDYRVHTFEYNANGGIDTIDNASRQDIDGKIKYPASYGAGLILNKPGKFLIGVDYVMQKWSDYRFYDQKDLVDDSWELRIGGMLAPSGGKTYWTNVGYRAGFNFGQDYIFVNEKELKKWGMSLGVALPMRKPAYTNQFSVINITAEYGQRGNNDNPIRENYFRLGVGFSLTDIWFLKRKYD